jgi:hypothetical protein
MKSVCMMTTPLHVARHSRHISAMRSNGPTVRSTKLYPTHQTPLIQGSQDEFAYVGSLFSTIYQIDSKPSTRGAVRFKLMMNSEPAPNWRRKRTCSASEIGGNLETTLSYRFFFLATTADLVGLAPIHPTGRFDFAIDGSRPRSNATSRSALIHTRSDSGSDESLADIPERLYGINVRAPCWGLLVQAVPNEGLPQYLHPRPDPCPCIFSELSILGESPTFVS